MRVHSAGAGSRGGQALSDRSPLFLSDLPDIHTPSLIRLILLARAVCLPLAIPPSPFLPESSCLLSGPQNPCRVRQSFLPGVNIPKAPGTLRGEKLLVSTNPPCAFISAPSPLAQPSVLPCSIKISCYLFSSHVLIWSASAAYICDLSEASPHTRLVFSLGLKARESPEPWVLSLLSSVSENRPYSGLE